MHTSWCKHIHRYGTHTHTHIRLGRVGYLENMGVVGKATIHIHSTFTLDHDLNGFWLLSLALPVYVSNEQ